MRRWHPGLSALTSTIAIGAVSELCHSPSEAPHDILRYAVWTENLLRSSALPEASFSHRVAHVLEPFELRSFTSRSLRPQIRELEAFINTGFGSSLSDMRIPSSTLD